MEPIITVVLPVYNQEKYIAETIESVLTQTIQEFEFLILDDGSTDHSAQIIQQYAIQDERITAFFEPNAGKCMATNFLVEKAKGQWCAFLDADDVMLPDRLEKQLAFHQANPEIAASSSHCYFIDDQNNILGTERYPSLKTIEEGRKVMENLELIHCAFTGLMASKPAFIKIGGLRSPFWPCEDLDFVNRLIENKNILLINQEVLMKYRVHSSSITAQKPRYLIDKQDYTYYCLKLRRSGQPEISFENFMDLRQKDSWLIRLNRNRHAYSQAFQRQSYFARQSKEYMRSFWQFLLATLLSPGILPGIILYKLLNSSKAQ